MKKGLLVGAGFSFDLGMPLVTGLTKDFFHFLNEERLTMFIESWKMMEPYGEDHPIDKLALEDVYDLVQKYRKNTALNYEEFLKELQDMARSSVSQCCIRSYQFVYGIFRDILCQLFYMYHVYNYPIYEINKQFYKDFNSMVGDEPLWVMTLNHDLLIEFLCMDNNIPISFGSTGEVQFPISNLDFSSCVRFGSVKRDNLNISDMDFILDGRGINIVKLHGALNEYSYDDDKEIIHINVTNKEKPIDYLNKVSKVMHEMKYFVNGRSITVDGEIAASDMDGELQFLRTSIKTGGYKYSKTLNPKPGEEKLVLLDQILNSLDEVTIVGYSFCDRHINTRLYNAMLKNENLKVWVINPSSSKSELFEPFDYNLRVRGIECCTPEWLNYMANENWSMENDEILKFMREKRGNIEIKFRNDKL
ncbi:hypothetical protein FDE99_01760 [Clostridium botulinum]|nr:hypothetical protein [Clostridium botulinum]